MAYAEVYGLKDDTDLENQQYSWLGSIFYFGYLFMEFPNLWIVYKVPAGRYMGSCLIAWEFVSPPWPPAITLPGSLPFAFC